VTYLLQQRTRKEGRKEGRRTFFLSTALRPLVVTYLCGSEEEEEEEEEELVCLTSRRTFCLKL
jgi:hypothetical protein